MRNQESIIGKTFGRLKVISEAETIRCKGGTRKQFKCLCECGKEIVTRRYYLTNGETRSCGCLALETRTKHGYGRHPNKTYAAWVGIKKRCYNPNFHQFRDYGGRGITMCDRWRNSFEAFLSDMGEAPQDKSIDRKDNDGNYEPDNCRWATEFEQKRNTRRNHMVSFGGFSGCLSDACVHFNIPLQTVATRLRRGWTIEEALSTPNGQSVRR